MELMVNCYNRLKIFYPTKRQQVCVRGCFSDWMDIFSGVPQGSVLGPILFLAYVNDLPDSVLSTLYTFADNTRLYHAIKSKDGCDISPQELDNITDWGRIWQTNFNSHKCEVLSVGTQVSIVNTYSKTYPDELHQLITVEEQKDLGVLFSSTLNFSHHVKEIASTQG